MSTPVKSCASMLSFSMCASWDMIRTSRSIRSAVLAATKALEQAQVPEPSASAEYLAMKAFSAVERRSAATRCGARAPRSEMKEYIAMCRQRLDTHVPIQYLVGDWDFHHITLLVRPPVLIPRPETEELVEHLLRDVQKGDARIVDVGCGSGAILLAALSARTGWTGVGVDIADEAVRLSEDNVKYHRLGSRARIVKGGIGALDAEGMFDAMVSNPPYIPEREMGRLEKQVRDHEDARALCGGTDGMDVTLELLQAAPRLVRKGGIVWLELDENQPDKLEGMRFEGLEFVQKVDDFRGVSRFCQFRVVEDDV